MFDFSKSGEIFLYDEITPDGFGGISSGDVLKALIAIGDKPLTVRINSPGGSVPEGVAIYNALNRHSKPVTTVNDGVAASISNYIFMVGEQRMAAENSLSMIHSPWSVAMGDAEDMRAMADLLDKAGETLRGTYAVKMGITDNEVRTLMDAETWYTGTEAVQASMATGLGTDPAEPMELKIAASRFKNTPACLKVELAAGSKTTFLPKLQRLKHLVMAAKAKQI